SASTSTAPPPPTARSSCSGPAPAAPTSNGSASRSDPYAERSATMTLRRRASALLAAIIAATTAAVLTTPTPASAANTAYVFAYFTESPSQTAANYGLHLAVSTDGLNWQPLNQNNPVVTPTAGTLGLRDPFILRKQ